MPFFRPIALTLALTLAATGARAETPNRTGVVIAGAGLSGLATAYKLNKAGIPYHILELTPRVGGRVRTAHYTVEGEEISTDSGMEEYWESNPAVKILEELKLEVSSDVAMSSMVLDGKIQALGDEDKPEFLKKILGADGYESLKTFEKAVVPVLEEIKKGKISAETMKLKDIDFATWVASQKLPKRAENWIRISIECEIGTEWKRIGALDGIAEYHIFVGKGDDCYRVEGGNEKFTDALAKAVGEQNISLNKRVTRAVSKDGKVRVSYMDTATNSYGEIEADDFVSTIPIFRLFELQFEPQLSAQKKQAMLTQTWGSYFKAHIFLDAEAQRHWTAGESSMLPILSDSELGVIYDGNPGSEGKIKVLSLLTTGGSAEAYNLMPLDQVRETLSAGLDRLWPGIKSDIKSMEFHRLHPRAIAAWPVGRSRFDEISQAMRTPENHFHFAGDFTESSHSDGAFISAERVAKDIVASRGKASGATESKGAKAKS